MIPLALLIALSGAGFSFTAVHDQRPAPGLVTSSAAPSDTIQVPAPAGDTGTDRTTVQAAFDAVKPGGTVQFAPGTYLLGAGANLTVPDVTVLGHPEGTILRGCDPEAFAPGSSEMVQIVFGCAGLYVQAERQTIRGITFEYIWEGIVVGPFPTTVEERAAAGERMELLSLYPAGGQRIEGNTFRATVNGLRMLGIGNELSIVRDNDFIDVFHAIGMYGSPIHFLDNRVTVVDPGGVPFSGHPGSAVMVSPGHMECAGHVVAGNRIEGYPDPIYVLVGRGETCRGVEIRDNTIRAARVKVPETGGFYRPTETDSTMVGAPITLMSRQEPTPGLDVADTEGVLENIVVQGNHILGAEGLGILVQGASRSRIAGNTISGVQRRARFPGLTWDEFEQQWENANGSGIWISPGSEENEIVGNMFEDMAGYSVVLEGNRNRVERRRQDPVQDLGTGNRVSVPAHGETRVLEVDGHAVHVYTGGWQHVDSGRPVVVFEGFSSIAWEGLPAMLAEETTVVAYERAGHGLSEWDGQPPTPEHMNDKLHRVLEVLGAPPPYTLVGHSIGGPLVVSFARRYSDRVAGLVLVDPTPPLSDWLASFDDIGVGKAGHEEFVEMGRRMVETLPPGLRAEQELFMSRMGDFASLDTPLDGPPVPVTVLLAGAGYEIPPELPSTFDIDKQHEALLLRQIARYSAWTRTMPDATIVVANNSRHCIHCWDPDLVAWAILRVLDAHR